MKKAKRFLTMFLVCIMAFGIVPISATNAYALPVRPQLPTAHAPRSGDLTFSNDRFYLNRTPQEIYLSARTTQRLISANRAGGIISDISTVREILRGTFTFNPAKTALSIFIKENIALIERANVGTGVVLIQRGHSFEVRPQLRMPPVRYHRITNTNGAPIWGGPHSTHYGSYFERWAYGTAVAIVGIGWNRANTPREWGLLENGYWIYIGNVEAVLERQRITASAAPNQGGNLRGYGSFPFNHSVNVVATPNNGWHFDGWFENGVRINSNTGYRFQATRHRHLEARFSRNGSGQASTPQTPTQPSTPQQPSIPSTPSQPQLTVIDTLDGNWHVTIPSNHRVNLFSSATSTAVTTFYRAGSVSGLNANRQITFSNTATRYRILTPDRGQLYFDLVDGMRVENRGIPPAPVQPQLTVIDTLDGNWHVTIPTHHRVNLFSSATSTAVATFYRAGSVASVNANRQITFSNGATRYRILTPDRGQLYFDLIDGMRVENRGIPPSPAPPNNQQAPSQPAHVNRTATIRYNANGGTGAPPSRGIIIGSDGLVFFSHPSAVPTRQGHTFLGWRLENDRAFGIDSPRQSITMELNPNRNVTLTYFAQWERTQTATPQGRIVTIRYNANGGSGAPASHTASIAPDGLAVFSLATTRPTRTGYTFLGWRLENDTAFGIDNPNQQIAIGLDPNNNATLTYFAQWRRN